MLTFPKDFAWGAATASYQIEGGWLEGGKGFSIWDAFAHTPGKITDSSTADVTCDHFHRWRDDVALMADLGLNAYRFSIAWSRILPAGRGTPNAEGIRFYSDLIDELLKRGITPWVTLYHWDLPLALQLELDGWTNPALADIYKDYAVLCFNLFGDRVKRWTTFNEPWVTSILGYGQGIFAPGRTSNVEPYLAAHTMLRAHGMAVREYRDRFQAVQKGLISMTTNCDWREPLTSAPSDVAAAERSLEFFLGWFADPLYRGDYPEAMRQRLGSRLPLFTSEESAMIRGSQDFFGLNHYTTMYATDSKAGPHPPSHPFVNAGIEEDQDVHLSMHPAWAKTAMGWAVVPWGFRKLLHWINARYGHPQIVVTENGCALPAPAGGEILDDHRRVDYLEAYLAAAHAAIAQGVDLRGYFIWSLMDNFEWSSGLTRRFGLYHVDYATGRRLPRRSAHWYAEVIRQNGIRLLPENPYRDVAGETSDA